MPDIQLTRRDFHKSSLAGAGLCLAGGGALAYGQELEPAEADSPAVLPSVDGSFTVVALPDTQFYAETWHDHFYRQTEWIVANREKHNIQFVMHLGDITDNNVPEQWKVAQKAIKVLDGKVPYSLATGNHDHGPNGKSTNRDTLLNKYFPIAEAEKQPTFGGVMRFDSLENSFHLFSVSGADFLVLSLEWGPRDQVVEWANRVVAKYPNHRVLMATHVYMYYDDTRYDWHKYSLRQKWSPYRYDSAKLPGGTNDGQELWEKLVSQHKNFLMTLNGHVIGDGLGQLTSRIPGAGDVHQMLVNYQMQPEGGEGYLRLMEFLPNGKVVQVRTFSPSTGKYKTDPQNQFVLRLNPALRFS